MNVHVQPVHVPLAAFRSCCMSTVRLLAITCKARFLLEMFNLEGMKFCPQLFEALIYVYNPLVPQRKLLAVPSNNPIQSSAHHTVTIAEPHGSSSELRKYSNEVLGSIVMAGEILRVMQSPLQTPTSSIPQPNAFGLFHAPFCW